MSYPLVCLGNPLLDLQANVDLDYLKKYDLKENDAILVEEKHMPIFDEVFAKEGTVLIAGGAAQNAARGAAYVLPESSVVYFGSVGNDKYAEELRKANEKYGVKSEYMVQNDIPTGKCAALITGHNRSLVTDLAAANHYKLEHLKSERIWKLVEAAKYFYVGGFHLTVCPPAILALGEHAAATNKPFVMNLSAPFLCQFFQEPMDASAPYWDILIGNETEAAAYAEAHKLDPSDLVEVAKHIVNLPKANTARPRTVIFTQGLDPTIVVTKPEQSSAEFSVKTFPVVPLAADKIVDTNGAGDAFAGGFLAGLVSEKPLDECVTMGQWLAALSVQEVGPSFPFPKKSYSA